MPKAQQHRISKKHFKLHVETNYYKESNLLWWKINAQIPTGQDDSISFL